MRIFILKFSNLTNTTYVLGYMEYQTKPCY